MMNCWFSETTGLHGLTVALAAKNFWGKVLWRAAERIRLVRVLHVELAQAKVTQRDVTSIVKQDVLRFQVAIKPID